MGSKASCGGCHCPGRGAGRKWEGWASWSCFHTGQTGPRMETLLWGPQGAGWLQDPHSGLLKCEALQVSQVPHGILPPFLGGTGHWPLWNVASGILGSMPGPQKVAHAPMSQIRRLRVQREEAMCPESKLEDSPGFKQKSTPGGGFMEKTRTE